MRLLTADADPERASASERRRARAASRRNFRLPLGRRGIALACVALLAAALFLAHRGQWDASALELIQAKAVTLSAAAGLAVSDVVVQGRSRTSPDSILAALGARRGTPILAIDPAAAKARLESIPWVRTASVERVLPGTLQVRIAEREPLALWQRNGKLELVDRDGVVLPAQHVEEFGDLLVLVGDDAPKEGASLLDMLAAEPRLQSHVTAAVRVGGRRWNLHLDNGIDIELPEQNPIAAWHELARLDRTDGLLQRDIRRVDFRLPDRLVVQSAPPPAKSPAKKKNPGRST
jgi:cell division protein FtsQ